MNKKMIIACGAAAFFLAAAAGLILASRKEEEEITYRETTVGFGSLTVGITESGSVDIGTQDDVFELDISALVRDSSADTGSSQSAATGVGSAVGMGSAGGGTTGAGGGMSSMDMFSQIFSFASGGSGAAVTADNSLTIAEVFVSVGQEVNEGDVLCLLEEESVSKIASTLESDVEKAQVDLEAAYAERKSSELSAKNTYDSSVAYGEYASTEREETLSQLEEAVSSAEEAIALAREELALYQTRLAEVEADYEKAGQLLENAEWSVNNTDKWANTYLYVTYVSDYTQAQSNFSTLEAQKEQIENSVEQTESNIERLETELAQAKRQLARGELTAAQTYELRMLAYNTAQETYDIAMAYVAEDVEEQEEICADARERWSLFSDYIQDNAVVASCSGIVTDVYLEEGDVLQTNDTMITLYDLEDVTITVTVDEEDMTDIAMGGAVNVVLTAYPDEVFAATVTEISDAVSDSNGNVTYSVTVTLAGDVKKLYQGMSGEVTFITKEEKEVLYISNRAVTRENGRSYVKVKDEDGTIRTVEVVTGFSDGVNVEITEGLSEGDTVLIESRVSD